MRKVEGTVLLLAGLLVAVPAFNDPCHTSPDRLSWIVGSGFLLGTSAFVFARRPSVHPGAPWAIGVATMVLAIFGIGFLAAVWWAASGCAN